MYVCMFVLMVVSIYVCAIMDVVSVCMNIYVYTLVYVDVVNVCVFSYLCLDVGCMSACL